MALSIVVRKNYEMTQAQAQALVNFEVMIADLGLRFWMHCTQCHLIGDPPAAEGFSDTNDDGTVTFKVSCRCQERVYRGTIVTPPAPRPLRDRRVDLTVKPEVALTRPQMKCWEDASGAMHQLKLGYIMRCAACQQENRQQDGVWGKGESNSSEFWVICACTSRVYRGSDAPLGH